eukprot:1634821-Rhodomonas_salina.2
MKCAGPVFDLFFSFAEYVCVCERLRRVADDFALQHSESSQLECRRYVVSSVLSFVDLALTLVVPVAQEDQMIAEHVHRHGTKSWSLLAGQIPGRTGKQMRERWHNQLDPNIRSPSSLSLSSLLQTTLFLERLPFLAPPQLTPSPSLTPGKTRGRRRRISACSWPINASAPAG